MVSGGGVYDSGATCTLHATPASGYQFDSWKKNGSVVSTNPDYSFTVTENATYTAYFSEEPVTYYTITTDVTPTGAGSVTGAGTYPAGSSVTLTATANNGYTFSQWQDGNTQNPRQIVVNDDITLTAIFKYTSVEENEDNGLVIFPNPTKSTIHIVGLEANSMVEIYNSIGELVRVVNMGADDEIDVRDLASGLYLLRCGNATLRFVKEL